MSHRLIIMHIEIVQGCQLSCVGCPVTTLRPKVEHMALGTFAQCLTNLGDVQVDLLRLYNYGEPLLHPDFLGVLDIVRAWGRAASVEVSTNAQKLDRELLACAMVRGMTRLVVSCDGDGTPEQYEALRPPARWSALMEFLEAASALRAQHQPTLELWTRTITQPEHYAAWRALLEPLGWVSDFRGWIMLPEAKNMTGRPLVVGKGPCIFSPGPDQLYVNAHGEVIPCCAHPKAALLGNLTQQTLSDVLASPVRAEFHKALASDRVGLSVCRRCEY